MINIYRFYFFLLIAMMAARTAVAADLIAVASERVHRLKIALLSTMLADGEELGEWGFSALVEVDGRRILFDTGAHADVVLKNARSLSVDLTTIPDVVLSHSHSDHVGGLITLRQSILTEKPDALSRAHVGEGMFSSRWSIRPGIEENPMIAIKAAYEKNGGVFVSHDKPEQLYPGVWLTGPIPRKYPERNWSGTGKVITSAGVVEDNLPEDMAMVFDTDAGLVVLFGCGHAGVINTLEYAQTIVRPARIHALIGGIHLFAASEKTLAWTSEKLAALGLDNLIGAHCTGIEPVYRFRQDLSLDRKHAVVGAVGATFELGKGIDPKRSPGRSAKPIRVAIFTTMMISPSPILHYRSDPKPQGLTPLTVFAALGVDNLMGAHCTGIEPVYRFRQDLSLDRKHAVVGAVGATFELGKGIDPKAIAQ